MQIRGSEIVVSGGASGLGAATSRLLAREGARVHIWDIDAHRGQSLAREIAGTFTHVNVTDTAMIEAGLAKTAAPRALIACAGIGAAAKVLRRSGPHALTLFQDVIAVNLVGSFNCARLTAAQMARCDPLEDGERGVIIYTSSTLAFEGRDCNVAYAASKAGVIGMVLPMARDLAVHGIRCNAIAPGMFDTPMLAQLPQDARAALTAHIPFPRRVGHAEEFASLVREVIANRMINGAVLRIDGALRNPFG